MNSLKHNNITFISLLGLSLAVHIIVFSTIHYFKTSNHEISIVSPYQQSNWFSVALTKAKQLPRNAESKIKTTPSTSSVKNLSANQINKKSNSEKNTTEVNVAEDKINKSQQYTPLLIRQIKSEISRHFNYPAFARRKGWQGKVLLEFDISHAGIISNIEIKNSSGYEILDHAAQKSLSQVQRIKLALNMDLPRNIHLQIPIIYQLTKG